MTSFTLRVRSIFQVSAMAAVCLLTVPNGISGTCPQAGPITTYRFVGQCTDCTGTGVGLLTLRNYTLGDPLGTCNFVSFSYVSNLTSFSFTIGDLNRLQGTIPASLPASANVLVEGPNYNQILDSTLSGRWNIGAVDYGATSSWDLAPAVPALSAPLLIGLAVMLALLGAFLLKALPGRRAA